MSQGILWVFATLYDSISTGFHTWALYPIQKSPISYPKEPYMYRALLDRTHELYTIMSARMFVSQSVMYLESLDRIHMRIHMVRLCLHRPLPANELYNTTHVSRLQWMRACFSVDELYSMIHLGAFLTIYGKAFIYEYHMNIIYICNHSYMK